MDDAADKFLPIGKLPADLLSNLLEQAPISDSRILFGPQPGLDCAVINLGDRYLVIKSDPITFATADIGWYLVQVNANDIATCGAIPRWLSVTLMMPEGITTIDDFQKISQQVYTACKELDISVIGGHSEITYGLDRPILSGTLIGEVEPGKLITPKGAKAGDILLLTKSIPIEAISILAREFLEALSVILKPEEIEIARNYLNEPGLSVVRDAQLAIETGRITAMHDPTEGGLVGALWEFAEATQLEIGVDLRRVPIEPIAAKICDFLNVDPYTSISSGSMLMAVEPADAGPICQKLRHSGIQCTIIGRLSDGMPSVFQVGEHEKRLLGRPARDAITALFEV